MGPIQAVCLTYSIPDARRILWRHGSPIYLPLYHHSVPRCSLIHQLEALASRSILRHGASHPLSTIEPRLREVGITLHTYDTDAAATSVRTAIAGRETFIIFCPLTTDSDYHITPRRIDLACPATFFTGKELRRLKTTSHPITHSFFEESLEHLQIPGILSRDSQDEFSSLKTLHVTGPVTSMPRVGTVIS